MTMEQKYKFAGVAIQTVTGIQHVLVALAPKEVLGFQDGDEDDSQIYYYFNGYEDFLECLVSEPVFTSCDDFTIRVVEGLYEEL